MLIKPPRQKLLHIGKLSVASSVVPTGPWGFYCNAVSRRVWRVFASDINEAGPRRSTSATTTSTARHQYCTVPTMLPATRKPTPQSLVLFLCRSLTTYCMMCAAAMCHQGYIVLSHGCQRASGPPLLYRLSLTQCRIACKWPVEVCRLWSRQRC